MPNDAGSAPKFEPGQIDPDEKRLVERIARGEESAFEEVVEFYQTFVAKLCYRLIGWSGDVEDTVQDVFVAAFRGLDKFDGRSRLSTWLATITLNQCRSHRRKLIRWRRLLATIREMGKFSVKQVAGPAEAKSDSGPSEAVRKAVAAMPMRYREVVVLRYLQEMPIERVGAVLGISCNAVRVRLHRARARLRDSLRGLFEE